MTVTRLKGPVLPFGLAMALLLCDQYGVQGADADPALEKLRAMRKELAQRKRRVWLNHDGCDAFSFDRRRIEGRTAEPQDLLDVRTTPLAKTHVDTLSYCTICSGFSNFTHRTKIGHVLLEDSPTPNRVNITKDLIAQGTDPLQVMIEFCRQTGKEIFWSMRMNDTHDGASKPGKPHFLLPQLKKDRPELMIGTYENRPRHGAWTAIDYGQAEIRDLCYRFFEEVCQNYDVDGVEMDFFRHLSYFKSVAYGGVASDAECAAMTDLIRRVRGMTEREGLRRGRPILVAVRVPDSLGYAKAVGLDVEQWMKEGLIDAIIGSGYFRLNDWEYLVGVGRQYGVQVYAGLSETRVGGWAGAKRDRRRASDACYRARAAACWQAGVDGIYIFNEYNATRGYLREIGDSDVLKRLPKRYFTAVRNRRVTSYLASGDRFLLRDVLTPQDPRSVVEGTSQAVDIVLAEEPEDAMKEGRVPELVCRLHVQGLQHASGAKVALNGRELTDGKLAGEWLDFAIDPEWTRRGLNRVVVAASPRPPTKAVEPDKWDVAYDGSEKLTMPTQLPWRRLFSNSDWVEEIRDGALFLADRGTGPNDWTNLAYPWVVSPDREVVAEAQVKVVDTTDPLGVCIRVANGRSVEYLTLEKGGIGLRFAKLSYPMDTTDRFHTYRLKLKGNDLRVYVDGELRLDRTGEFITPARDKKHWLPLLYGKAEWNRRCLLFGSASGVGKGEALWKSVRFRGKAVSLKWLDLTVSADYPKKAAEITDWDEVYACDALPSEPWQKGRPARNCRTEVKDGCLLITDEGEEAGSYCYHTRAWGAKPDRQATAEARVKLLSGWCSLMFSNGAGHDQLYIRPEGIKLRYGGRSYAMATTDDFHVYRVTIQGSDVQVYVDGKLRIDGIGRFARKAADGRNAIQFGAANSPSRGSSLWDFVRFTTGSQ